jgi:hypothetical protein
MEKRIGKQTCGSGVPYQIIQYTGPASCLQTHVSISSGCPGGESTDLKFDIPIVSVLNVHRYGWRVSSRSTALLKPIRVHNGLDDLLGEES